MNTEKVSLKHVAVVLIVGIAVILGYYGYRSLDVRQTSRDLHELRQNITRAQRAEVELLEKQRQLETPPDLVAFVEELYESAEKAGLAEHDVTTSQQQMFDRGKSLRRGHTNPAAGLKNSRLQVELRSRFREIAEYLKYVEASKAFKQIRHFEMIPDGSMIRMTLQIDLYQLQNEEDA